MEAIKIWAIEDASNVVPLEKAQQIESENLLEEMLVKNPDMLMRGLRLVGRQTPVAGGQLDLLGVDSAGQLVVFELKRGPLSRDAVAQIIDYASGLESMSTEELASHISERSGTGGIEKINDLDEQVGSLDNLKPIRLFLIGLGADDATSRMVEYLTKRSVDISLLTFHGFVHDGKTFLAKQIQTSDEDNSDSTPSMSRDELWKILLDRARERGVDGPLKAARDMFDAELSQDWWYMGKKFWVTYWLSSGCWCRIRLWESTLHVGFSNGLIDLCPSEFENIKQDPSFETWGRGIQQQSGIVSTLSDAWEAHAEPLTEFTRSVYQAWRTRQQQGDGVDSG